MKLQDLTEKQMNVLYNLTNMGYIADFGDYAYDEDNFIVLFDCWDQVQGRKKYNDETNEWDLYSESVFSKLVKLAKVDKLPVEIKDLILYMNDNFAFTDEYSFCEDCRKIHHREDLTWVDSACCEGFYCDECLDSDTDLQDSLVERAVGNFRGAVKPNVTEATLTRLGFAKVNENELSMSYHTWGESRLCADDISPERAERIVNEFDGVARLVTIEPFDCLFDIYVPVDRLNEARELIGV